MQQVNPYTIHIASELPISASAEDVAQVFYPAFAQKIHHLELFARSRQQALRTLARSFRLQNGLYALDGHQVVGVAGVSYPNGQRFVEFTWRVLVEEFGALGGTWRFLWTRLFRLFQRSHPDSLHIDAIAVAESVRGQGVGTLLLERVFEQARAAGYRTVVLEVVDTNPGARALYARLGFRTIRSDWYGAFTARAGFSGVHVMHKELKG